MKDERQPPGAAVLQIQLPPLLPLPSCTMRQCTSCAISACVPAPHTKFTSRQQWYVMQN